LALRLYPEVWRRGGSRAATKVVIGDGAEWIWNLADQYFPGAMRIVDLFHARQHLWNLARKLHPSQQTEQRRRMMVHQDMLEGGQIE
jgi:transposase